MLLTSLRTKVDLRKWLQRMRRLNKSVSGAWSYPNLANWRLVLPLADWKGMVGFPGSALHKLTKPNLWFAMQPRVFHAAENTPELMAWGGRKSSTRQLPPTCPRPPTKGLAS